MKYDHVVVQSPSLPAEQLFLLYHAAGDNPVAMGEIGRWFAAAFPRALVVSIGAPHADAHGGFSWYDPLAQPASQAIEAAMAGFVDSVRSWQQQSGVKAEATALIGFSQGATMALEAVSSASGLAGRVVAFSGCYITLPQQAGTHTTLHLIHGDNDNVLPLTHALEAEERLTALGGDVTLDIVDDLPHAIDHRAMQLALDRLQFTIPRRYFDEAFSGSKPGEEGVVALM